MKGISKHQGGVKDIPASKWAFLLLLDLVRSKNQKGVAFLKRAEVPWSVARSVSSLTSSPIPLGGPDPHFGRLHVSPSPLVQREEERYPERELANCSQRPRILTEGGAGLGES